MAEQLADIGVSTRGGAVRLSIRYTRRDGAPDGCVVSLSRENLPGVVRDLVAAADEAGWGRAVRDAIPEAAHG
jgi:hypothetical protein